MTLRLMGRWCQGNLCFGGGSEAKHHFSQADFRVKIRLRESIDDGHSLEAEVLKKRIALVSDNQFSATVNKNLSGGWDLGSWLPSLYPFAYGS